MQELQEFPLEILEFLEFPLEFLEILEFLMEILEIPAENSGISRIFIRNSRNSGRQLEFLQIKIEFFHSRNFRIAIRNSRNSIRNSRNPNKYSQWNFKNF